MAANAEMQDSGLLRNVTNLKPKKAVN